jgi:hypothetical protein
MIASDTLRAITWLAWSGLLWPSVTLVQFLPPSLDLLAASGPDGNAETDDQQKYDFEEGWVDFHRLSGYYWLNKPPSYLNQPSTHLHLNYPPYPWALPVTAYRPGGGLHQCDGNSFGSDAHVGAGRPAGAGE